MKVLALNSSPRGEGQSKTELMLNCLAKGMREAGAEVEIVHLRQKKVNPCIGCYTCWTRTPGLCIHRDDMTAELFPKWLEADLAVYASPLYHFTVNSVMKAFIERTLPVLEPFLETRGERTYHPARHRQPGAVLLSVAGFPEDSVFDLLSAWANFIFGKRLAAEVYRAGAETLTVPFFAAKAGEILDAVAQAGRELVTAGGVSPETMALVRQPIHPDTETWKMTANLMWKTCIAAGITPKEFDGRGLIPRPDSLESFLAIMGLAFNPAAAREMKAVIQFDLTGDIEGSCHLRIENGCFASFTGAAHGPDLVIQTPFSVWFDIMTGKADGQQAFFDQKYRVAGDLSLLMRLKDLFQK